MSVRRPWGLWVTIVAASIASVTVPVSAEEPILQVRPSHNLYGITGLIETPTADVQPDAQISVTSGFIGAGFLRNTLSFQALPGIETAFRYSVLSDFFVEDDLFDRSFDIKLRLREETEKFPAIAIGLQDFLGTGVYSGEYIVATKGFDAGSVGSFRVSGGVGWGRFADEDGTYNPLRALGSAFDDRNGGADTGGDVNFGQYFQGETISFFGGVEWDTPVDGLRVKAELSQDDYDLERTNNGFEPDIPFNFGVEYAPTEGVDIGAYYVYGTDFGIRVTFSGNPFRAIIDYDTEPGPQPLLERQPSDGTEISSLGDIMALINDAPPETSFSDPRVRSVMVHTRLGNIRWAEVIISQNAEDRCPHELAAAIDAEYGVIDIVTFNRDEGNVICTVALRPAGEHAVRLTQRVNAIYPTDWYNREDERAAIAKRLAEELEPEDIDLIGIEIAPHRVQIYIENRRFRATPRVIGRTVRALTRVMPPSVESFEITPVENSIPVTTVVLQRSSLEDQVERPNAAQRTWATTVVRDAAPVDLSDVLVEDDFYPRFSWSILPATPINIFDPDEPFRADLAVSGGIGLEFFQGFSFNAAIQQRIIGDLDEIDRESDSLVEERVRSDIAEYLEQGEPALTRFTFDYVRKLSGSMFGRLSAGAFERMFAGIGGEVLWKPSTQSWGVGLDLAYVRQRGFNTLFDLRDYDTLTGHVSFYWDTDFHDLAIQIDAGRYLAGDWGGTFGMKRRFDNGWEIGGFFTLTDIPFSEFGEGSFDKGIFLTIPLDWVLPYKSRSVYSTVVRPLTRDGGARLEVSNRLYPLVENEDSGDYRDNWGDFWE